MDETLSRKLRILADAAKYDASCASSGAPKRKAGPGGLGSTTGAGICHAYTPDGRCVSLLKILLTNYCLYDCAYCVNRRSSNVKRAKFSRRRGGDAHHRVLQAQLHRGPVPVLRHYPHARPHHGGDAARRQNPSAGPRFRRLHPPQDDTGGEPMADRAGRFVGGPAVDQSRTADAGIAGETRAREERRLHQGRDGADARADRRGARGKAARFRPPVNRRR